MLPVRAHKPDVAITDIRMPPSSPVEGIEAAQQICSELPAMGVLVLSQHRRAGLRGGAVGRRRGRPRLSPEGRVADVEALLSCARRRVAHGGSALDPKVVAQPLRRRPPPPPLEQLTPRDRAPGPAAQGRSKMRDRRGAGRDRARRREARDQHLLQARPGQQRAGPPGFWPYWPISAHRSRRPAGRGTTLPESLRPPQRPKESCWTPSRRRLTTSGWLSHRRRSLRTSTRLARRWRTSPVQLAYGRARRTHAKFADRNELPQRSSTHRLPASRRSVREPSRPRIRRGRPGRERAHGRSRTRCFRWRSATRSCARRWPRCGS